MLKAILSRYGPGLLYGRNTIMSYLDDWTRVDSKAAEKYKPNSINKSKGKRATLIDELRELEEIRSDLKELYLDTLEYSAPHFPKIVAQILPKIEAPFLILRDVIIPIIEQISAKTPESVPRFLEVMNHFLSNNTPAEVWDVPEVSEKVTQWMKTALILPNCDHAAILHLWLKFIKLRAKIEDVLILASVWFEHQVEESQLPLFPLLISDMKLEMSKATFLDYIDNPSSPITVTYYPIMTQNMKPPSTFAEQPRRKCAAYKGFLYVIDSTLGFTKLGTGKCGTIFGQTELHCEEYIDQIPTSMAFCNERLLVRFAEKQSNDITIIDPATLKIVGTVQTDEQLPSGPFTAFRNILYIVTQKTIYSYKFENDHLTHFKTIEIELHNTESEFIPAASMEYANLFTDGIYLNVILMPKDDSPATVNSFILESGESVEINNSNEPKISPFAAFDCEANTLIFAPSWAPATIYNYSERYALQMNFGEFRETTGNPCLDLINAIIPSTISKITSTQLNCNRHYVFVNTDPLFNLIELGFKDDRYSVFLEQTIILLIIFYSQVNKPPTISIELLVKIIQSESITQTTKIELLRALIKHGNSPLFNTIENCDIILQNLKDYEITQLFSTGFNDIFTFALTFLNENMDFVLSYASRESQKEFPFLSQLIFTLLRGILIKKCFSPTIILPILVRLPNCHKSVLTTLVPPIIPLIERILQLPESENYTNIILKLASTLIQYTSIKDLQDFADMHASVRDQEQYIVQTKIDETPHPYENDMKVIHHYDFPGAVEVVIEFDKQTNTEPSCDYLQIFADEEMKQEISPRMSGKYAKWQSPIVTKSQHLTFIFFSDSTVTEWGYRAIITARFIATRSFLSPKSFFDLSYSISEMLYNFARRLNSHSLTKYPQFHIPHEVVKSSITKEQKAELREQLRDKINCSVFDLPTTFPSTFSVLHYLVNNDMFDPSLLDFAMAPPSFIVTESQDTKRIFHTLASFLMSNNFSELPETRFNFLIEAIKGTDDALKFAINSLQAAEKGLQSNDTELLMRSASHIQIAFRIGGDSVLNEGKNAIVQFLKSLSSTTFPLNMPLANSLIEKSNHLFTTVLPTLPDVVQFLETICESLATIEINSSTMTIPFIGFALSVALILPNNQNSQSFFMKLVLYALRFNIPSNIPLISQIVEKYKVHTSIQKSPIIKDILSIIGKNFITERPLPTVTEAANISPSFSISRAAILRDLIENDTFSDLADIINEQNEASLGALLVLSQRYLPPHPSQKVRLISNNQIVTLVSFDYHNYHFKTEKGNAFILPSINNYHFVYMPTPFIPILPAEIPAVSQKLISAVEKCVNGPYQRYANLALAELSINSQVSFASPSTLLQSTSDNPRRIEPLSIFEDKIAYFDLEERQSLFRLTRDSPIVSFKPQTSMKFGFITKNKMSNCQHLPISISNNIINIRHASLNVQFESDIITIGLYGPYKQIFLQSGSLFILTQIYIGAIENPQPYFYAEQAPELVSPNDIPSFLFYSRKARQFSHIYSNNRLFSIIDDLNSPTKMHSMHFLPTIQKDSTAYVYLEVSTHSKHIAFSLIYETIEAHILYQSGLDQLDSKTTKIVGIFISLENNFAFITHDGNYVESSAAKISLTDSFSLLLHVDENDYITVNNGCRPFIFDVDEFLSTFVTKDLPTREPSINPDKIPIGLSTLVPANKLAHDFVTPPSNFYRIPFERPIYIPTKNIVTSFTPLEKISATLHSVDVFSDIVVHMQLKTDQIVSLTESLVRNQAQFVNAIQRIQSTMPQNISPFLFFANTEKDEQNKSLLTKKRRDEFFDKLEKNALYSISANELSKSLANSLNNSNSSSVEVNSNLLIKLSNYFPSNQILRGECNPILANLLKEIYHVKPETFKLLANMAFEYLTTNMKGNAIETMSITNLENDQIEIGRIGMDCLYVRVLPHSIFNKSTSRIKILNIFGNKIEIDTNSQELLESCIFTFLNVKTTDLLYIKLISIDFHKSPLAFALQMVSFMLDFPESSHILHQNVLLPLLKHCQDGKDILFPSTYALWYNKCFLNNNISDSIMRQYGNCTNLEAISRLPAEICTSLTLFTLFCYANCTPSTNISSTDSNQNNIGFINDLSIVRERTVNFINTMTSIIYNNNTSLPFIGLLMRLTLALMSPFGNKLHYLGKIGQLKLPVLTSASYVCTKNCRRPKQTIVVDLSKLSSPAPPVVLSNDRLKGVYIKLNKKITDGIIFVNDVSVKNSTLINVSSKSVTIRLKNHEAIIQIIPVYDQSLPTVNDYSQLYHYYHELHEKLTIEHDSLLVSIAQSLISFNMSMTAVLDDEYLTKLIPSISPDTLRYRISCYIAALLEDRNKFHPYHMPGLSNCICSIQHTLGVVLNAKLIQKKKPSPPLKDFEYGESDLISFFTKFYKLYSNLPARVRIEAPKFIENAANPENYISITKFLRLATNNMFESRRNGMLMPIPNVDDSQILEAYQGFGILLGLRFISGKSIQLPISKAIIRYAFGGEISQDDLNDANWDLNEKQSIEKQLEAIRLGVQFAVNGVSNLIPDDVFPACVQITPLKSIRIMKTEIPEIIRDPCFLPFIKRKILEDQVSIQPEDKRGKLLDSIFEATKFHFSK
ncbi:hypothetical protein TRFO_13669 [Tritrichomonas foetus]|uniref:CUB domain-containing protein n=1 Tax=Tritrichomonas foetus TaxID=1144522 RepID=A0A1J4KX72_9EUKA|nr:hypothetical protein TRFO_13669 [Tritrichomonas foetus]|eukprot:OHT15851.1 hypothetical protein TRFO_13669 [Tritrichomonas foetus]